MRQHLRRRELEVEDEDIHARPRIRKSERAYDQQCSNAKAPSRAGSRQVHPLALDRGWNGMVFPTKVLETRRHNLTLPFLVRFVLRELFLAVQSIARVVAGLETLTVHACPAISSRERSHSMQSGMSHPKHDDLGMSKPVASLKNWQTNSITNVCVP
jgi:hypothetical protein